MNVCFITGTLGRGGAERQLLFMLRALRAGGVRSRLLCLTKGESYEEDVRDLGIEIEWLGARQNRFIRSVDIIRAIRRKRTDIVQSSHFYTNIYAAVAGRTLGISNIGAIRSDLTRELAAGPILGRMQLKLPHHLIVNSEKALNAAVSRGIRRRNIDLVRNVVDRQNTRRPKDSSDKLNVVFVGRLSREKRPERFVDLASRLSNELGQANLRFQIIGDGPLRTELERRASEHGLSGNSLEFLGEFSEMESVYNRADILVLTSKHEGMPNVILEAMSYGIPVIATNVGGVSEILTAKSGMLVDPLDFEQLVDASKRLIGDPVLRQSMGRCGRDEVASKFSFDYLQERLISIYDRLLGDLHPNDQHTAISAPKAASN